MLIFLLSTLFSEAQSRGIFSGRITEKASGETLVGANIYVKKNMSLGAVSDFNGYFSLSVPAGETVFTISFTGMKTQNIPLNIVADSTTWLDIVMEPFSTQFKEVVVKAGKFEKPLEDQTVSIEIIKPRLIEARNTRSVETILDLTPGVTILDEEPQIRGGSGFTFGVGSKVAVFIDDLPITAGDAGKPDWSLIPVENIKQIEVVKGASSVLSGSAALSGAIYIRTEFPGTKPLTKIQVFGGFYTAPRAPASKWWNGPSLLGGASFLHSQQLGDGSTDLVVGGIYLADQSYIGAPIPGPYVSNPGDSISDKDMANRRARINFNLRRRSKKKEGLDFGLNGNIMQKKQSTVFAWLNDTAGFYRAYPGAVLLANTLTMYFDPFVNFYAGIGVSHNFSNRILYSDVQANNNQSNRVLMIYNNYRFNKTFSNIGNLQFIGGLSSQFTASHSNMYDASGSPDNTIWNMSAYMEFEKKIANSVNLSAGMRIEHFRLNDSIRDTKPVFRFGASLKMLQETYLRASLGQGYRFPTITERYIRTTIGSFGVFNNADLLPETSWNAEVGVKQGFKFATFYGYFDMAVFYQQYNNTIEYLFGFWGTPSVSPNYGFRFVNTGRSKVTGVDISLNGQAKLPGGFGLNTMFGYTYTLPIALEPDLVFAYDNNPGGNNEFSYNSTSVDPGRQILKYRSLHTVKMDVEFIYRSFAFGLSLKFFSKIENMDKAIFDFEDATVGSGGTLQPILYKNYFYNHNNGNTIVDMRISYSFATHHKLALISDNIFNRRYSLRPLKAEPMRNVTLQYSMNF
ncbi:MAG: TonB-dependent receptor [Bacteroidales bacterium]|nr:TonB-dependent receptor [Bacteroidales bacterium]